MKHKPFKINEYFYGYTLIETLLVIAVLAIMVAMGLSYYQQTLVTQKVERTAAQMQQLSQAATAYYVDNGCWPNSSQCKSTVLPFQGYMPVGISANSWGNSYSFQTEPQFGKKFQILSGILPSTALADRLIGALPGAVISSQDARQVMMEITIPAQQAPAPKTDYQISMINYSDSLGDGSASSFSFSCPPGWIGRGFAAPFHLAANDSLSRNWFCPGTGSFIINQLSSQQDNLGCPSSSPGSFMCQYNVIYNSYVPGSSPICRPYVTSAGATRFVQVGFCIPPQNPSQFPRSSMPSL